VVPKRVPMSNGEVHSCTWMGLGPTTEMDEGEKKIVVGGSLGFMIVFSTTSVPPVFLCLSLHALCCPPLHSFPCLLLEFASTMYPWVLDGDPLFLFSSQTLSGKVGPTQFQQMLFLFFWTLPSYFSSSSSVFIISFFSSLLDPPNSKRINKNTLILIQSPLLSPSVKLHFQPNKIWVLLLLFVVLLDGFLVNYCYNNAFNFPIDFILYCIIYIYIKYSMDCVYPLSSPLGTANSIMPIWYKSAWKFKNSCILTGI